MRKERLSGDGHQTIWLCRHGNRIDFVDPSWKGDDPPLSKDGMVQAWETGLRLRGEGIRQIFASPFLRAVQTAHRIAEVLDLPVKVEHGLSEWLNPEWFSTRPTHVPAEDLRDGYPRVDATHRSTVMPRYPEGAEEAFERAGRACRILADAFPGHLLFVGHGHSVTGMARAFVGAGTEISTGLCALVKVVRRNGRAILELNGDTGHLTGGEKHADRLAPAPEDGRGGGVR